MLVFEVIFLYFMKIEQNYIVFLVDLNSADLRGNSQRLHFTKKKKHSPGDEHDDNGEI